MAPRSLCTGASYCGAPAPPKTIFHAHIDWGRDAWNHRYMRETILHDVASEARWREQAGCLEYPPILFFGADDSEPQAERRIREDEAKKVCARCLVRQECLDYALTTREAY